MTYNSGAMVTNTTETGDRARRKQTAALLSIGTTLLLVAAKLIVGLLTGSLALLSEALHSGIDLVGTVLSFAAVRLSARPPDQNHPYGHAKAESLAALSAVFLLGITAFGILYEAYSKIFGQPAVPDITPYSIAVPMIAMAADWARSRYLGRVARETGSQALAADAANFTTDLWSSGVVLLALVLIWFGGTQGWPPHWLSLLDGVAGVAIALLIFGVAGTLVGRTVDSLMDAVPRHLVPALERAAADTPGVMATDSARLRYVGDKAYADLVVNVPRDLSLEESEAISEGVIAQVRGVVPGADVVVHTHPVASAGEKATDLARLIATRLGVGVHHVRSFETPAGLSLDMHMEVHSHLTLAEAHSTADELETGLRAEMPDIKSVEVHIEPRHDETFSVEPVEDAALRRRVLTAAEEILGPGSLRRIEIGRSRFGYVLRIHCTLPGSLSIIQAHAHTAGVEHAIREAIPDAYRVTVHPEPG
ncbi:MAG: cation-efflux pump [Chloroflexia bacterium]